MWTLKTREREGENNILQCRSNLKLDYIWRKERSKCLMPMNCSYPFLFSLIIFIEIMVPSLPDNPTHEQDHFLWLIQLQYPHPKLVSPSNLSSFPFELLIRFIEVYVLRIEEEEKKGEKVHLDLIKLEMKNIVRKQAKYSRWVNLFRRKVSHVDNERSSEGNARSAPRECIDHRVHNMGQHWKMPGRKKMPRRTWRRRKKETFHVQQRCLTGERGRNQ